MDEVQPEVNHIEAENMSDPDLAKGTDSKSSKKRRRSDLPSPASDRPTRERKSVERLVLSPDKEVKEFRIPKGAGVALKDIPNIVFKLSKRRGSEEPVQALHKVLFGKTAKHAAKGNILKFSGFVWSGNEEKEKLKIKERLERVVKETLFQMSDLLDLNLSKSLKKEEGVLRIFEFLESPDKTTDELVEERDKLKKSKKAKKKLVKETKSGRTPGKSPKGKKTTPNKKQITDEEDEEDVDEEDEDNVADFDDAVEDPEAVKDEPEEKSDDDFNEKKSTSTRKRRKPMKQSVLESEEDEEEDASPKKSKVQKERRKPTPKAKKVTEKKPKSKAAKRKELSDDDLKAAICELLQNADFAKVTFTDVMKQLGDKFKVDLTHIKSHLKSLIQEEIARLVGEGDNDNEDSDSERGGNDDDAKSDDDVDKKKSDEHKDDEDDSKEDALKEDDGEGGDGAVEDSDGDDDGKGEKVDEEDADEDMNSEEDKAEGVAEETQVEGDDEVVKDASTDSA